ncbi:Uncharacterized protein TCM_011963 [Theobroma cacao]|uniref:Uncharacterized protein n=1 Tax=Theobroma cacao TaxID=3641 RepID=A0A061FUL3_THECC|nr:Uncharacterized protein TCM_011963 [Theobroma cacao]
MEAKGRLRKEKKIFQLFFFSLALLRWEMSHRMINAIEKKIMLSVYKTVRIGLAEMTRKYVTEGAGRQAAFFLLLTTPSVWAWEN